VLDVRWRYDPVSGTGVSASDAYEAGHVPGAAFVDLEDQDAGLQPHAGGRALPDRAAFERAMRGAGVGRGTRVVAYDTGHYAAARLWWLLRYFGHDAVAVLDGGLDGYPGPLRSGVERPPAGDFVAGAPRADLVADLAEVRRGAGAVLLDARRPDLFRGDYEPKYGRAGHIPGARSAHWRANLRPDGRFEAPAALRARYERLGVGDGRRAIVYCGSGTSACHDLLALEVAGLAGARLYPGSWREWSATAGAPVSR
jgi:thiosulfate/3-mercaptopyruvate sulfurtransferase